MNIERIRTDAMFDSMAKGVKKTNELVAAANNAEKIAMERRRGKTDPTCGEASVGNFLDIAKNISVIEKAFLATHNEDMHFGTDAWVKLTKDQPVMHLPVQIKSSDYFVDKFKESKVFNRLNELIIVLNTSKKRLYQEIESDFIQEYSRVLTKIELLKAAGGTDLTPIPQRIILR